MKNLQQRIEDRAANEVQEDIRQFVAEVNSALKRLFHVNPATRAFASLGRKGDPIIRGELAKSAIANLLTRDGRKWPNSLWTDAEQRITDEVMSVIDPLQKTLMAKPPSEANEQKEEACSDG